MSGHPGGYWAENDLLVDHVRAAVARTGEDWHVNPGKAWCYVAPHGHRDRPQGWKLHVSATPLSAPIVVARAASVLIARRASFKFATTIDRVEELVGAQHDRGGSGKVITVYPENDERFTVLAEELDRITRGLAGPRILSDKPYRPGSLVHYRFGVIAGTRMLDNDGTDASLFTRPDGTFALDRRMPWFATPEWAPPCPIPDEPRPAATEGPAKPVLLGGRFAVHEAIVQANKGGVYVGADRETGAEVVIKQARRHTDGSRFGRDAQDRLRHEADMLDELAPLGFTPRKIALFEQQGDLFLAEDKIDGQRLRDWAHDRVRRSDDDLGAPLPDVLALTRRLIALVAAVHERGVVLRDLTPSNVMVAPDGTLRLIDLELAARPGDVVEAAATPGYGTPEAFSGPRVTEAPGFDADCFALGATVFHLATGLDPVSPSTGGADTASPERMREFVERAAVRHLALRRVGPLILGLLGVDGERWTPARAAEYLDGELPALAVRAGTDEITEDEHERLLTGGLGFILATMDLESRDFLWPAFGFAAESDPCNVQTGAAGVLAVLTRAAGLRPEERLRQAVADVSGWIERKIAAEPRVLPGLYFGRSGTAWALHDAARLLGDGRMAHRAESLALNAPVDWPNPDICHGMAGAGLTQLHFLRATGDERFAVRLRRAADNLLAAVEPTPEGVMWEVPKDFASQLAGIRHYGFAHGVAGIGAFLLAAFQETGDERYLDMAQQAGRTLVKVADQDGGQAWWPSDEREIRTRKADGAPSEAVYWCNGSSGVGTFLIRLWRQTGDPEARELAEQAAVASWRTPWYTSPAACHGTAGNAEFLLDMADALGEDRYRRMAAEMSGAVFARHATRDGHLVVGDDSFHEVTASYHTGLGGVVALLLRLRHGGPRPFMAEGHDR
ncbi:serine/threonine protein kinase [Acrocarpospora phusangensis]|uniref:Serine/threonine protein kinase n=1 Tax=Acrocarpospora phusangensis TaxID=1070424 RepID=A0A919Q983_9ACTN|nr:class IV lanthionine synthetase LanL [Acrocarpospora phusangensis]GIH23826.1 serine/threonine protein kinase [Acrocarpospora phusangensis]